MILLPAFGLFISLVSAFDWSGKTLLGYRSVHPAQAKAYETAGNTLTWNSAISTEYWGWYGNGVYLLREFGAWIPSKGDWYCMVYANTAAFKSAEKLRMPAAKLTEDDDDDDEDDSDDDCDTGHEEFKNNHELINEYITAMGANAKKAIRIINDDAASLEWEIVIPPAMLNSHNGGLGIGTVCKESKSELPTLSEVDVASGPWNENVKGDWDTWVV